MPYRPPLNISLSEHEDIPEWHHAILTGVEHCLAAADAGNWSTFHEYHAMLSQSVKNMPVIEDDTPDF